MLPTMQDLETFDFSDPACVYALIGMIRQLGEGASSSFADKINISKDTMEEMYGIALFLYENKKYVEAHEMFEQLVQLDILNYKYALGAGACLEGLKFYPLAIIFYALAAQNDPTQPVPFFHAGECAISYGSKPSAKDFLAKAVETSGDKKEFQEIKEKSLLMLQGLSNP